MGVARKKRNRSTPGKVLKMDTRLRQMHTWIRVHRKRGNKNRSYKRKSRK